MWSELHTQERKTVLHDNYLLLRENIHRETPSPVHPAKQSTQRPAPHTTEKLDRKGSRTAAAGAPIHRNHRRPREGKEIGTNQKGEEEEEGPSQRRRTRRRLQPSSEPTAPEQRRRRRPSSTLHTQESNHAQDWVKDTNRVCTVQPRAWTRARRRMDATGRG
jgi:hypothetical protein